jgi:Tfp pilus assembly protein PilF
MLVADPPPTDDGQMPGAGTSDMDRGVAYVEKEAWKQALPHLDRALEAQPNSAEANYYRALAKFRLGEVGVAEDGFKKAIELDDKLNLARALLGEIYLTTEPLRGKEAIDALEPAAAGMAKDPDVQQLLAFAYRVERQYDKSTKAYEASLAIENSDKVRFDYADMLFEASKMDKAAAQMRTLLPKFAKDVRVVAQLAHRFAKAKAYTDCKKAFTMAISLDKKQPAFYLHRGICRHALKESEDLVRNDYKSAVKIDPKFQPGHYYLAVSWLHSKKRQKAVNAFEQAIKLNSKSAIGKKARAKLDEIKKASKRRR